EKQIKSGKFQSLDDKIEKIIKNSIKKEDSILIVSKIQNADNQFLNKLGDKLIQRIQKGIVLLFNTMEKNDKFSILLVV
ncbi:MAG: hypothetical protein ACTSQG_11870, partial [Promethearchaeota archaeon]